MKLNKLPTEQLQHLEEIKRVADYQQNIEWFYGSVEEYERYKSCHCEILGSRVEISTFLPAWYETIEKNGAAIDINNTYDNKSFQNLKQLCDKGIEAIVNVHINPEIIFGGLMSNDSQRGLVYGLPVKIIKKYAGN
jgi:hypothetical protein